MNHGSAGNVRRITWRVSCSMAWPGRRLRMCHYKGAGPALTDLMGGQIDAMFRMAWAPALVTSGRLYQVSPWRATRAPGFRTFRQQRSRDQLQVSTW